MISDLLPAAPIAKSNPRRVLPFVRPIIPPRRRCYSEVAVYIGIQQSTLVGQPDLALFRIRVAVGDKVVDSTTTANTLRKLGYEVPDNAALIVSHGKRAA